jgi:hypothetical protein
VGEDFLQALGFDGGMPPGDAGRRGRGGRGILPAAFVTPRDAAPGAAGSSFASTYAARAASGDTTSPSASSTRTTALPTAAGAVSGKVTPASSRTHAVNV